MCQLASPAETFWTEKRFPINRPREFGADRTYETLKKWVEVGACSKVTGNFVQLEAIWEGSVLVTTREAYLRFLKKLNNVEPEE